MMDGASISGPSCGQRDVDRKDILITSLKFTYRIDFKYISNYLTKQKGSVRNDVDTILILYHKLI